MLVSNPSSTNMQAFGPSLLATSGREFVFKVRVDTHEHYHPLRRSPPEATKIAKPRIQRQPHAIYDPNFP